MVLVDSTALSHCIQVDGESFKVLFVSSVLHYDDLVFNDASEVQLTTEDRGEVALDICLVNELKLSSFVLLNLEEDEQTRNLLLHFLRLSTGNHNYAAILKNNSRLYVKSVNLVLFLLELHDHWHFFFVLYVLISPRAIFKVKAS